MKKEDAMAIEGAWKCPRCDRLIVAGRDVLRTALEEHMATHELLRPCIAECGRRTFPFESNAPGYCMECATDPRWHSLESWDRVPKTLFKVLCEDGSTTIHGIGEECIYDRKRRAAQAAENTSLYCARGCAMHTVAEFPSASLMAEEE